MFFGLKCCYIDTLDWSERRHGLYHYAVLEFGVGKKRSLGMSNSSCRVEIHISSFRVRTYRCGVVVHFMRKLKFAYRIRDTKIQNIQ